jgi:hypothetical protein
MKRYLAALQLSLALALGMASGATLANPAELRSMYTQLRDQLRNNPYERALYIESAEANDSLKGDVYAVLDHPFSALTGELKDPNGWCDILILPFNTKYCHPVNTADGTQLVMRIGRKATQPVHEAFRVDFALQPVAATPEYFESRLRAREGPVGTHDYRIVLSAIPLDNRRTFMHLSYSYGVSGMSRFAMQAYLSTVGADKVGFSLTGRDGNGQPIYMGGVRGAIERNVMRYYLAIDAHLASLNAPPDQQLEKRLQTWFSATERYARQLREMDRSTYLAMKRNEHERQQARID